MYSIRVLLVLYWFLIMICIVCVQLMYQPAVNNQFTGYSYGSTESAIDNSSRVLKVKTAPSKGAVKRENFKQYHFNTYRYTVQSQDCANDCQFCANSKYFINLERNSHKNSIKSMDSILKHGFVQMLPEPLAHSAGSCEAVND